VFFVTYLRRELRRRMRQAIFVALGLALGVGLVVTVSAASAGIKKAQSKELSALYGVGTDVTVTGATPGTPTGPNAPQPPPAGFVGTINSNMMPSYAAVSASKLAQVARLRGVSAADGVLSLSDLSATFSSNGPPAVNSLTVDGVATGHLSLGPLSGATLISGHAFTAADANADVAVVDSGYATSHSLKAGSALSIDHVTYTVIGIVRQPQQGGSPPTDVYIPLAQAQAFSTPYGRQTNDVNTIYVTASSAADISAVSKEISSLLPGATVTTQSSLASEVTGSISTAAKLANDLGKWLAILVLIAAFAVASLLTMGAVTRRVREFGTLKAIGWRTRRIISQVLGESAVMGVIGAVVGVGLGFAGAAIISAVAPKLSENIPENTGDSVAQVQQVGPGAGGSGIAEFHRGSGFSDTTTHTLNVALHPSVTVAVIVLAVVLAVAGALLAASFGSWRIAQLRPADALSQVA
jgi:putative ABC transport system permease protein